MAKKKKNIKKISRKMNKKMDKKNARKNIAKKKEKTGKEFYCQMCKKYHVKNSSIGKSHFRK